jgi:hypothetical protein
LYSTCRRDRGQRHALFRLELQLLEPAQETALDFFRVRLKQDGQPLQMLPKLVA